MTHFWQNIDKPIIGLAPMDGVTDAPFRFITAKYGGPDVMLTEFVNVEAAFYAPQTLIKDLTYSEIERPVVAQIYGHEPELFYLLAHIVCELGFDGLDINMGCPAKKVAARGSGAGLIRTPYLARTILRAARRGIEDWFAGQTLKALKMAPDLIDAVGMANRLRCGLETPPRRRPIPLSVKTRLGYDAVVVESWVRHLLDERPAAITLHGRTLKQGYKGYADWDAIARAAEIAKHSSTLVLGNGDLQSMGEVYRRLREVPVDGVLVGRATQGNPWIFREAKSLKCAMHSGAPRFIEQAPVDLEERFKVMLEHASHFEQFWGTVRFVGMRKHLTWYCRDSRGAAQLRARLVRVRGVSEVRQCVEDYLCQFNHEDGSSLHRSKPVHSLQAATALH